MSFDHTCDEIGCRGQELGTASLAVPMDLDMAGSKAGSAFRGQEHGRVRLPLLLHLRMISRFWGSTRIDLCFVAREVNEVLGQEKVVV